MSSIRLLVVAAALAPLSIAACGDETSPLGDGLRVEKTIGASGGNLSLPGGIEIAVPAGALSSDVNLTAELIADLGAAGLASAPSFLSDDAVASIALTPHGTQFATPITLTVPFTGSADELVLMRLDDDDDTDWEAVGPISFTGNTATAQLSRFSTYSLAQMNSGACPCFNGQDLAKLASEGTVATGTPGYYASYALVETLGPIDADYCAANPSAYGCWPEGTKEYRAQLLVSGLPGDAFKLGGRAIVHGKLRPDGTVIAGGIECRGEVSGSSLPSQTEFTRYFPQLQGAAFPAALVIPTLQNNVVGLDAQSLLACHALIARAVERGSGAVQVAFSAQGLPANEPLRLSLDDAPVVVSEADTLAFGVATGDVGDDYTVTIDAQPDSATCAVTRGSLTGALAHGLLIEFTCSAGPTTAQSILDTCDGVAGLGCTGVTLGDCIALLEEERDVKDGACATEFDTAFECIADNIDATPPSAGCDEQTDEGWELAFPSPCQTELDAYQSCAL